MRAWRPASNAELPFMTSPDHGPRESRRWSVTATAVSRGARSSRSQEQVRDLDLQTVAGRLTGTRESLGRRRSASESRGKSRSKRSDAARRLPASALARFRRARSNRSAEVTPSARSGPHRPGVPAGSNRHPALPERERNGLELGAGPRASRECQKRFPASGALGWKRRSFSMRTASQLGQAS